MEPKIDPLKRDFKLVDNRLVEDQSMESAVLLRVTTQRGSVPGMPWFGSRLHTLNTLNELSVSIAEGYLIEAVSDLISDNRIRNVSVRAAIDESDPTCLKWELSWNDQADKRHVLVMD